MGHHYTPREHLRKFQLKDNADHVWMYDKLKKRAKVLPVDAVAQERQYYPDQIEKELNLAIEIPGNASVRKLLQNFFLNDDERMDFSRYIVNMFTRGPRGRKRAFGLAEKLLPDIFQELQGEFDVLDNGQRVHNLSALKDRFRLMEMQWKQQYPKELIDLLRTPFQSENLINAIVEMSWEILPAAPGYYFVTSDTPAHFFESIGIGGSDGEFAFTLSKDFALLGHCRGQPRRIRFHDRSKNQMTKEINRRIISTTERFIFSHQHAEWIEALSQKPNHLNAIVWS